MTNSRVPFAAVLFAACLLSLLPDSHAALPDYKIGDIARDDIITPIPLSVPNPAATETLQQAASNDVPVVLRFNPKGPDEAEVALRATVLLTRYKFMRIFQEQLLGRTPTEADLGSPAFVRTVAEVSRDAPADFPYDQLTSLWVGGGSEETFVLTLAQPIRQTMAQIIVDLETGAPLPANKPLRLVTVKNLTMPLGVRDLDGAGLVISQSKVTRLSQARQLVENSFPIGQQRLARFASTFVHPNARPDPVATEILQARALQNVTAHDDYPAAQPIVRKGQIIDRKTLNALDALRESHVLRAAEKQLSLPAPSSPAPRFPSFQMPRTEWLIAIPASVAALATLILLWRQRPRRRKTRYSPARIQHAPAADEFTLVDAGSDSEWQDRALAAEDKVARAHEAVRSGVLGWMKDKFVSTLFRHRAELLAVQLKAQAEMEQLERRLEQLHAPLQERIQAYEKRIAELEAKLASKGEENRRLLGARITVARHHLQVERSRFETN